MRHARSGFTLVEVAVTLVIIGVALVLVLQGLNTAKITAAYTHDRKVARDLALLTLGQIEGGLLWEEVDDRFFGTYAEEGYDDFSWEVVVGDEALSPLNREGDPTLAYDTWRDRAEREAEADEDDEEIEAEEPFEKVRIRVTFPQFGDFPNQFELERWIPWDQVYGPEDEGRRTSAGDER